MSLGKCPIYASFDNIGVLFVGSKSIFATTPSLAMYTRFYDLKFVVDELERVNAESRPSLRKEAGLKPACGCRSLAGRNGCISHSATKSTPQGRILIDSSAEDAMVAETATPVLILAMDREQWNDHEYRLWTDHQGPRVAVNLRGAEHLNAVRCRLAGKGCREDWREGAGENGRSNPELHHCIS